MLKVILDNIPCQWRANRNQISFDNAKRIFRRHGKKKYFSFNLSFVQIMDEGIILIGKLLQIQQVVIWFTIIV